MNVINWFKAWIPQWLLRAALLKRLKVAYHGCLNDIATLRRKEANTKLLIRSGRSTVLSVLSDVPIFTLSFQYLGFVFDR